MKLRRALVSFLLGSVTGLILYYALYRMSLPIEPFIYLSF